MTQKAKKCKIRVHIMKKSAAYLLSILLLTSASAMAEVYNPNGKLFVYREYMEAPGNKEIVNRIFRVDNEGKVEVLFCASPGGTEDPASEVFRAPDLMQGQFKIEGKKLYFYTSDTDRFIWPGRNKDETVNPIQFSANNSLAQVKKLSEQLTKEKDEQKKAELKKSIEEFQTRHDYLMRIYEMKKIEYVYDAKKNRLHVNEKSLGKLPKEHLYQGYIYEIQESQKTESLKQILTKRQEAYSSFIYPEHCYLQEGAMSGIEDGVCKNDIRCSIRPFGFDSFFRLECPTKHCADPTKPDLIGCFKEETKKLSPDFEAYDIQ